MIEELYSSSSASCSPPSTKPTATNESSSRPLPEYERVESTLTGIVKHYSDSVFAVPATAIVTATDDIPAVVQHCLQQLLLPTNHAATIIIYLLQGYLSHIRPALLQRPTASATCSISVKQRGIPVLKSYLQLVDQLLLHKVANETIILPDADSLEFLQAMASDVSMLTRICVTLQSQEADKADNAISVENPAVTSKLVSNIVLPLIIQLLTRAVNMLSASTTLNSTRAIEKCAIAMLAFGNPRLDPRGIVPDMEAKLMIFQQDCHCLYIPIQINEPQPSHCYLNLGFHWTEDNFWDFLKLDGRPWEGPVTQRVVDEFWQCLYQRLVPVKFVECKSENQATKNNHDKESISQLSYIIRECITALSNRAEKPNDFAMAVRAHFFGRDLTPLQEDRIVAAKPKTQLMLGREVSVDPEKEPYHLQSITKPYIEIPSRVHVAMHYILLLNEIQPEVLDDMMPIVYELLDATASYHIGMGAAALIHLLLMITQSENQQQANKLIVVLSQDTFLFSKYTGTLLPVLDLACQTCREGPPFALLARAQSLLCEAAAAATNSNAAFIKHRRKVTRDLLTILDKYRHKVSDPDGLLWALLVGGIIPLLHQHATLPECTESVDALEMGRLGLQALLPIVRYSAGYRLEGLSQDKLNATRKLLGPSVLALVHLMIASYPIMPRHGGKIMAELMALMGNLHRQGELGTQQDALLTALVKDAAGVALVICGERAEDILRDVESKKGEYDAWFGDLPGLIRAHAERWKKQQPGSVSDTLVLH